MTPVSASTRRWASAIKPVTSAAVAPPRFTIQFAWSVEICALPMRCPFRPVFSIREPAKCPEGLVNTLPKLG